MALPSVEAFERAGLDAWPGIEVQWDRHWVRRAAGGYTKRANSTQCFDPDDFEDADLRVISACSWMVLRKIKPVFLGKMLLFFSIFGHRAGSHANDEDNGDGQP